MENEVDRLRKTLAELENLLDDRAAPQEVRELVARARDEADTLPRGPGKQHAAGEGSEIDVNREGSSFASRLSETAQQFEDTHPRLFTFLGEVADALARIGI